MIDIEDITVGESYACKFRVKTMLDEHGRPAPNLTDTPLKGVSNYEGIGVLMQRDPEQRIVKLRDERALKNSLSPTKISGMLMWLNGQIRCKNTTGFGKIKVDIVLL